MRIIVDANVAGEFIGKTREAVQIVDWILKKGTLSTGGKNYDELIRTPIGAFLVQAVKAGRGVIVDPALIETEQKRVAQKAPKSDDEHVIALAIVGETRLLFSKDKDLIADFTGRRFLSPKGKCYQRHSSHAHLLR